MKSLVTARPRRARFRRKLSEELARRCARNSRYSLRAFAQFLEIDHSSLSQILRGRRTLTERTIRALGSRLGLDEAAIEQYVSIERAGAEASVGREMERLTSDTVELLADWHHFAILELCSLEGFEADSRWIARALDLEVDEVNTAVQRLLRLGLMQMKGSRWIDTSGSILGEIEDFHSASIDRLTKQLQSLLTAALYRSPAERQGHSVSTLGVATKRLPEAFAVIDRIRDEIFEVFEEESKDDVYKLEISFFPVTTLGKNEEETNEQSRDEVADSVEGP